MKIPDNLPEPFAITRSNASERDFNLLKNFKTSILGDISFQIEDDNYTLDCSMLVSKSKRLEHLLLSVEKEDPATKMNNFMRSQSSSRFRLIVGIIYGKEVNSTLNEDNFVNILNDMDEIELEMDLEIFKNFIEKVIEPRAQLNSRMFELLGILLDDSPKFNYLLSTVSRYFSSRLLKIYEIEEFLRLSVDKLILILLHESQDTLEKKLIGRVCAKWICHDYRNRIEALQDLVNVTKYRYDILPYCNWDPNSKTELWQKKQYSDEPIIRRVETYFNELLLNYSGKVNFDPPSALLKKLITMNRKARVLFFNDQSIKWMSYFENELFCDIGIDVRGTIFKLHRIKLSSVSGYFNELFANSNCSEHALHQIDPETFENIIRYIYKRELKVTSTTQLINALKGSKFLKMDELYEKCCTKLLEIADDLCANIFEIFQYVCENERHSTAYAVIVRKINALWPKLDENPQFVNISLNVLKEIIGLPELEINNTDEILDLCSKWIFYDIQNRYKYTIEVAGAINRNFSTNGEELKLEIPLNSVDYSKGYVRQQLIRILSSTPLVTPNTGNVQKNIRKPCFVVINKNGILCAVDANFNDIVRVPLTKYYSGTCYPSATVVGDELYMLFQLGDRFYFQLWRISSKQMISLATDARMNSKDNFVILSCNDEVYFCSKGISLRYVVEFNRWVPFYIDDVGYNIKYTSDGEKLFKVFAECVGGGDRFCFKASYYDFETNGWIALPDISILLDLREIEATVNKHELAVLISSNTYSFNWTTQTWTSFSYLDKNLVQLNGNGRNILYITDEKEVYSYSTVQQKWTMEQLLDIRGDVIMIHRIGE